MSHFNKISKTTESSGRRTSFFPVQQQQPGAFFQPKLTVGPVDDVYEREADAVADKVMRMQDEEHIQTKISPVDVQRKCAKCEEEENVQRKEVNTKTGINEAPAAVQDALNSGGNSLDNNTRSFMENRFEYDFSNVKIHTGSVAAKSAQSINALAYTSGNNIVFNEGQYSPNTESGKRLLAHELTHVVQQNHSIARKVIQRQPAGNACPNFPKAGVKVIGSSAKRLAELLSACTGLTVTVDKSDMLQATGNAKASKSTSATAIATVNALVSNKVGAVIDTDPNSLGTTVGAFDHACPGRQYVNISNIDTLAKPTGSSGGFDACSGILHEMAEAVKARELAAGGTAADKLFTPAHTEGTSVENKIRKDLKLPVRDQNGGSTQLVGSLGNNQMLVLSSTVFGSGKQVRTHLEMLICTLVATSKTESTCRNKVEASHVVNGLVTFKDQKEAILVFNKYASDFGYQPLKVP